MKKRNGFKKGVSLVLVLMMTVSLLTACGSKSDSSSTTSDSSSTTSTSETTPEATKEETSANSEVTEVSIMAPLFVELPNEQSEVYQTLTDETGIKWNITWVSSSDYTTKFQTVLASGDLPDVVISTDLLNTSLNQGIQSGYFADLTDIFGDFSNYPNLLNNSTKGAFNYVTTTEGRIMGVPRTRAQIEMSILMRQDWMDKCGIAVPKDIWEWKDALATIVKSDVDGNGKDDTIGYAAHAFLLGGGYIDDNMSSAFGAYNGQKDEEGGLIYYQLTDGYYDYVNFVKEMYDEGIISSEFSVMSLSETEELFQTGKAASYTRTGTYAWTYQDALSKIDPAAQVTVLPAMKGTENNTTAVLSTGVYGAFFINSQLPAEKIKQIVDYFEYTCTPEFHDYAFFGLEGYHYDVQADGTKKMTEAGVAEANDFKSLQQVVTTIANLDMKLFNQSAPKEFNDKVISTVSNYADIGRVNHFRAINSKSWSTVWSKNQSTFEENTILAVCGEMSMEDYKQYVVDLRSQDDMKACFKEFAENDGMLFPEGY